jgi:tRNA-binding EMAP/Myf-like protein
MLTFQLMGASGVVVGRVVEIFPHSHGDFIWLARVDIGIGRQPLIVWGGVPVVKEGSLVPVALPGAWLPATKDRPNPYKIRRRRYRGEISEGMLCSLAELGWDSSAADQVAQYDYAGGLQVGESLDSRCIDWQAIMLCEQTTCPEQKIS